MPTRPETRGNYQLLDLIEDPRSREAFKLLLDRLAASEGEIQRLRRIALQQDEGPIQAGGQRLENLAAPVASQDAVSLGFLQKYVAQAIATGTGPTGTPVVPSTFPSIPQGLLASSENPAVGYLISWQPSEGAAPITYTLYRKGPGATGATVTLPGLTTTSHLATLAGLTDGDYQSWVTATNALGTSGESIHIGWSIVGGIFTPTPPPPPPPPGIGPIVVQGRGFARAGQRLVWKGISDFPLLWFALNGQAEKVEEHFAFYRQYGVTVPRIMLSLAGTYWDHLGLSIDPRAYSNFNEVVRRVLTQAAEHGLCPEIVIFGAFVEYWPLTADQITFVRQVVEILDGIENCFVEIANEPVQIGFTDPSQVIQHGQVFTAGEAGRRVRHQLSLGAVDGVDSNQMRYNQEPATYLTSHISRDQTPSPLEWVINHAIYKYGGQINPVFVTNGRPSVSDEPINAGVSTGATLTTSSYDDNPAHWYGFGALGQVLQFGTTFHAEVGIIGELPSYQEQTMVCFQAWLQGINDVPFDQAGQLFGATTGAAMGADSPFTGSGTARLIVGRHDGLAGFALVLDAPAGWNTAGLLATGWSATRIRDRSRVLLYRVQRT